MNKVKPEDRIPARDLTAEAQRLRVEGFNNKKANKKTTRIVSNAHAYILSLEGKSGDSEMLIKPMYKAIDFFMKKEIYPSAVCRPGCAHCCRVPVQVTAIEAEYISQNTPFKFDPDTTPNFKMYEGEDYCPLLDLDTGLCQVYEYRPFGCRMFATFDSYSKCEDPMSKHAIFTMTAHKLFKDWHTLLIDVSISNSSGKCADIRDWFKKYKV